MEGKILGRSKFWRGQNFGEVKSFERSKVCRGQNFVEFETQVCQIIGGVKILGDPKFLGSQYFGEVKFWGGKNYVHITIFGKSNFCGGQKLKEVKISRRTNLRESQNWSKFQDSPHFWEVKIWVCYIFGMVKFQY